MPNEAMRPPSKFFHNLYGKKNTAACHFKFSIIHINIYSDNCNILRLFDLNGEHEGDPLIVAGIWGVISALHPVKVHNTLYVSLNRFIITEAVMWGNIYHKTHVTFRYVGTSVE